jgi:hypothetical protein
MSLSWTIYWRALSTKYLDREIKQTKPQSISFIFFQIILQKIPVYRHPVLIKAFVKHNGITTVHGSLVNVWLHILAHVVNRRYSILVEAYVWMGENDWQYSCYPLIHSMLTYSIGVHVIMVFAFVQLNIQAHSVDSVRRNYFIAWIEKCMTSTWKNDFCQLDNPCYHPICQNDGLCSVLYNTTHVSYTCTCSALYTGQHCETYLQLPSMDGGCLHKCLNNGSCINDACVCASNYVGATCQLSLLTRT